MLSSVAARCSRKVDGHPCGGLNTALGVLAETYAARCEGHTYSEHTGPIQFLGVVKGTVNAVNNTSVPRVDAEALIAAGRHPRR